MTNINIRCILLLLVLCCDFDVAEDDWIDPYDMENFDHDSMTMKNKPQETVPPNDKGMNTANPKALNVKNKKQDMPEDVTMETRKTESCSEKSSPCLTLFRQYVRSLLYHVKGKVYSGEEDLNLRVRLTAADIEYLEKYVDSTSSEGHFHNVHEVLSSMVKHVSEVTHKDPSVHRLWIETVIGMPIEKFLTFGCLAAMLLLSMLAVARFHFSWWKLSTKLIFFLFVISVFWQWYELYKKEEAKQHMTIINEMPESCRKREKEESVMSTFFRSLTSAFTFQTDECLEYYEHLLIAPFWKVAPTQALGKTVIRFFVDPMKDVGEAIRDFLTGLLQDLPVQLWPVALGGIGLFSFLSLFMYFGYRISLPFGVIAIEPGTRTDNSQLKAIMQQAEELKALKTSQDQQMKQILDALTEERAAIEEISLHQPNLKSVQETLSKAIQNRLNPSLNQRPPVAAIGGGDNSELVIGGGDNSELLSTARQLQSSVIEPDVVDNLQQSSSATNDVGISLAMNGYGHETDVKEADDSSVKKRAEKLSQLDDKDVVSKSETESFENISVSNLDPDTIGHGEH